MTTLLWFSRDLRLADNPALAAAIARGEAIVPVFILDDDDAGSWRPGAASRWWLHHSLESLGADIAKCGNRLILRKGPAAREVERLVKETQASAVFWNRRYEPWAVARSTQLKARLAAAGVEAQGFNAGLLHEPSLLRTQTGKPYSVFTPFWKALKSSLTPSPPLQAPKRLSAPDEFPPSDDLQTWHLLPRLPWDAGFRALWTPGEGGAFARLERFLDESILTYPEIRNVPAKPGTTGLSPHLHFGEIGPRQIWRAATAHGFATMGDPFTRAVDVFLSEIAWREFAHHLLFHSPSLPEAPLRKNFADFPWRKDAAQLQAWQKGETGFPIIDAGMRELWHTGWMHNRVRMIVASFLVKNLLIHWSEGEDWFWDTLLDADLANNAASWQWVAGCGADAAPYFRIFNPVTQAKTYDPDGAYVRKWVPEIGRLPIERLHAPWTAKPSELSEAEVRLGATYPEPIVDLPATRARALEAFQSISRTQ